jgi:hypothetical protein
MLLTSPALWTATHEETSARMTLTLVLPLTTI